MNIKKTVTIANSYLPPQAGSAEGLRRVRNLQRKAIRSTPAGRSSSSDQAIPLASSDASVIILGAISRIWPRLRRFRVNQNS